MDPDKITVFKEETVGQDLEDEMAYVASKLIPVENFYARDFFIPLSKLYNVKVPFPRSKVIALYDLTGIVYDS